jgi:uncharacterized membrane protein YphA (DoxX/SURF4 family)
MQMIALGVIFAWYGVLKLFAELSPAETIAVKTIDALTFGLIPSLLAMKLLAVWELVIGIGFLVGRLYRWVLILFFVHMSLTFTPLFLFPELCFSTAPYAFTLLGQYIVKNILFILVGIALWQVDLPTKNV